MTALSRGHHQGAGRLKSKRALKPGCGALIPAKLPASKNLCSPSSQIQLNCDALSQADCLTRRANAVYQAKHDNHKQFICRGPGNFVLVGNSKKL